MTLRTAARIGVAGALLPFAQVVAWLVVATVVGQPLRDTSVNWNPWMVALGYLQPAAVLGFLVVLRRVSEKRTAPSRLTDTAMAASIMVIVALAMHLRWPFVQHLFTGVRANATDWLFAVSRVVDLVLEPVAWLAFLVTFVRWAAPPLSRATCRAAGWLAVVLLLGALWPVYSSGESLVLFWWDFPPRGSAAYYTWNGLVSGFLGALRWLVLLFFATAVWRMRPAAEPAIATDDHVS